MGGERERTCAIIFWQHLLYTTYKIAKVDRSCGFVSAMSSWKIKIYLKNKEEK